MQGCAALVTNKPLLRLDLEFKKVSQEFIVEPRLDSGVTSQQRQELAAADIARVVA